MGRLFALFFVYPLLYESGCDVCYCVFGWVCLHVRCTIDDLDCDFTNAGCMPSACVCVRLHVCVWRRLAGDVWKLARVGQDAA
jgi:hypothetical protein